MFNLFLRLAISGDILDSFESNQKIVHVIEDATHNGVNLNRTILIHPNKQIHVSPDDIQVFNKILGNETRIRLSHYSDFVLSFDPIKKNFIFQKEDQAFKPEFKINKDGDSYIMKYNGFGVCYKKNTLRKCKKPTLFEIRQSRFGFIIKYNGRCLTLENPIKFLECNENSRNQDFIFEYDRNLICRDNPGSIMSKSKKSVPEKLKQEKKYFEKELKKYKIPNEKTKSTLWKLWSSKKRKWPSFGMC